MVAIAAEMTDLNYEQNLPILVRPYFARSNDNSTTNSLTVTLFAQKKKERSHFLFVVRCTI